MHDLSGGLILGYHGCDVEVGKRLLDGESWAPSGNSWDWLGPGVYFWEANPKRGYAFACELKSRRYKHTKVKAPFVVGAVISPGLCLDLTTKASIDIVKTAHAKLLEISAKAEAPPPSNNSDLLRRDLDCAVIRLVHQIRAEEGHAGADSVRGVFLEGNPIYEGSAFYDKTHIQIAVRNLACIKGVFRVPPSEYE